MIQNKRYMISTIYQQPMHPIHRTTTNELQAFKVFSKDEEISHSRNKPTPSHSTITEQEYYTTLQENEQRMQLAFEATNVGFWDLHVPTGKVYFSTRWKTMLGYTPDELPNNQAVWENLLHPEDKADALQIFEFHIEGLSSLFIAEFRLRAKNGEWIWILSHGRAVEWDKTGKPVRVVGTNTDITKNKQSESITKRHVAASETLTRIASRFHAELDLTTILNMVCEETREALNEPMIALFLYEEQHNHMVLSRSIGIDDSLSKHLERIPFTNINTTVPVHIFSTNDKGIPIADRQALETYHVQSVIQAIANHGTKTVGMILVLSHHISYAFDTHQRELMLGIANHAAQAISTAQVVAHLEQEREILRQRIAECTCHQ